MAKKKKPRNRRPVAPPVHSAPATAQRPVAPPAASGPSTRPEGAAPPPAPAPAAPKRKTQQRSRAAAKRRRNRIRNYALLGLLVALVVGAVAWSRISAMRENAAFNRIAAAAGCGDIRETGESGGNDHLPTGGTTEYDTSPPTHGAHDGAGTVPAGVYDEPFKRDPLEQPSIYRAVHSLEHGAVIVWHDELSEDDRDDLERTYRDEEKVIVVPYPELRGDTKMALSAWGRLVNCDEASTEVVEAFVERFRGARSAPEANNPI